MISSANFKPQYSLLTQEEIDNPPETLKNDDSLQKFLPPFYPSEGFKSFRESYNQN